MIQTPVISVVTVVRNDPKGLQDTIESLLRIEPNFYEHIIQDGNSTDQTKQVAEKFAHRISSFTSEKDFGIYDAMNRAISKIRGDWVLFLNAGDTLDPDFQMSSLGATDYSATDIVYGDYKVNYDDAIERQQSARPSEDLWKGMITSHQSIFFQSRLFKTFHFDTRYSILADLDFLLRCQIAGLKFAHIPQSVSIVSSGGYSDSNRLKSIRQHSAILRALFPKNTHYQIWCLGRCFTELIKLPLRRWLPRRTLLKLIQLKYRLIGTKLKS